MLNLDAFQSGQLTQANVQNVFGLAFTQFETRHQSLLGLIALANDGNHFVNVEQHQLTAFQDVDAVHHLAQAMLRAAHNGLLAERNPLKQHLAQ